MKISNRVEADDLERSEMQLGIFVAVTVVVLAVGMAVLMYPVVFSHQTPGDRTMRIAFWGFCALCVLLTVYLWDRHATIRRLRRESQRELGRSPVVIFMDDCCGVMSVEELLSVVGFPARQGLLPALKGGHQPRDPI